MGEAFRATTGAWIAVSHSGPDLLNKPIRDPKQLFDFVFAIPPDTSEAARRASVLDAVAADTRRLMAKLGTGIRQRFDQHLTHINAIQRRLRAARPVARFRQFRRPLRAALSETPGRPNTFKARLEHGQARRHG